MIKCEPAFQKPKIETFPFEVTHIECVSEKKNQHD